MHNLLLPTLNAEILSSLPDHIQSRTGSSSVVWVIGFILGMILLSVVLPRLMSR